MIVRDNLIQAEGPSKPMPFTIRQLDGRSKAIEITAAVMTARGEWLIADRKANAIHVFSAAGKYVRQFLSRPADRLALGQADTLAALDRNDKSMAIVDRDGKPVGHIGSRGQGYQFENPVDVAFDALGHVYVLDRDKPAVLVFTPQGRLVVTFSIAEKSAGAFQKAVVFGLDSAARLFIFDDRVQRVQVYQ
jgi:hypothetical protein